MFKGMPVQQNLAGMPELKPGLLSIFTEAAVSVASMVAMPQPFFIWVEFIDKIKIITP